MSEMRKHKMFSGRTLSFTVGHGLFAKEEPDKLSSNTTMRDGERKLLMWKIPTWQRERVWTREQEVMLIESIWMGLPIGCYVYNRLDFSKSKLNEILIDGQQRWTAIERFVDDKFPVFGYTWSELSEEDKRAFRFSHFPAIETSFDDETKMEDLYNRLAYGGTPHECDC